MMIQKYKRTALAVVILLALGYGFSQLTPRSMKLGEVIFYNDNNIELKVILVHENIPLHYVGNRYSVACKSPYTRSPSPADAYELKTYFIEEGWNLLPGVYLGNGLGDNKDAVLSSLADEANKHIFVKDTQTVVVLDTMDVRASFDGCRSFVTWNGKENIPDEVIASSTPEFDECVAYQKKNKEMNLPSYGDCADMKFAGTNVPEFTDVTASSAGNLSFRLTSGAIIGRKSPLFETKNFGKTWELLP